VGNRTTTTSSGVVTVPGAPTAVSEAAGNESITMNFGAPASDGGAPITGYTVNCTSSNGGAAGSNTGGAGATSIVVIGLTNGKTYSCAVVASNSAGTGAYAVSAGTVTPNP